MSDFQGEVWRPVPSVPEYLASSAGRVMRLPYVAEMPRGGTRVYGGEPTFGVLNDGRYQITVGGRTIRVHRMICEAFNGPAPSADHVAMHGDEDSTNNRSSNLSWGTQKQNLNAPGFVAYCRGRVGPASPRAKWAAQRASV